MEKLNSKVLLFGEYAVLHNGMALVIPWDKYNGHFEFTKNFDVNNNEALQSNEYLRKFCAFVSSHLDEKFVLEVKRFEQELNEGLFFRSNIPKGYGLGSSGALVAAITLRYLVKAKYFKDELKILTLQKLKELKKNLGGLESFFHGVSSGIDPLSIILNEPILYKNTQQVDTAILPTPSESEDNVIFLLDTKCPRVTFKMMDLFNDLHDNAEFKNKFATYVEDNNNRAIEHFLANNTGQFYQIMYHLSSFQLDNMKDFFPEDLHKKVALGLDNGDYFLKLCGAGGGGFVLGFTHKWEITKEKLKDFQLEEIYRY